MTKSTREQMLKALIDIANKNDWIAPNPLQSFNKLFIILEFVFIDNYKNKMLLNTILFDMNFLRALSRHISNNDSYHDFDVFISNMALSDDYLNKLYNSVFNNKDNE